MGPRVSVIFPFRDQELEVGRSIEWAVELAQRIAAGREPNELPARAGGPVPPIEVIAIDEESRDNTLSALCLLQRRERSLVVLDGAAPGSAIARGTRAARGQLWVVVDHLSPASPIETAARAVDEHVRAAVVPGEATIVEAGLGRRVLTEVSGGLIATQSALTRHLTRRPEEGILRVVGVPQSVRVRARHHARALLARVGLGRFDRAKPLA